MLTDGESKIFTTVFKPANININFKQTEYGCEDPYSKGQ